MAIRVPQADLYFDKYTDTQLIARAQQVHDKMLANIATFPALTLPVDLVDLQTYIDDYTSATVAAIKGTKTQTTDKLNAKRDLQVALKSLAVYVNNRASSITGIVPNPGVVLKMAQVVNMSGFMLSKDPKPVDAVNGIPRPQIRRAISNEPGLLKILIRQYTNANRNTLLYQVQYRTSAIPSTIPVPAGPWLTQTFTGQNQIVLTGLESGKRYDWQIAAIGGRDIKRNDNPPVNYTQIESVVII